MRPAILGRRLRLVVRQRGITRRRIPAVHLAIDIHRLRVLPVLRQLSGLAKLHIRVRRGSHVLHPRDRRIVRVDRAQPVQILSRLVHVAAQLRRPGHATQRFRVVRIDVKHLLPLLRRQVHAAPHLERMRLLQQRLRRRLRRLPRRRPADRTQRARAQQDRWRPEPECVGRLHKVRSLAAPGHATEIRTGTRAHETNGFRNPFKSFFALNPRHRSKLVTPRSLSVS